MKSLLTGLFLLVSVITFGQKYGHCDVAVVAADLPEVATIQSQLETKAAELEGRLTKMYEIYQGKITEFQANVATMSADEQQSNAEEIQNLEVRIQEAQQNSQAELMQLENDLKQPLFEKVRKAIEDVSVENGYTLIFDTSSGAVLYAGGDDVNDLVKSKLGL